MYARERLRVVFFKLPQYKLSEMLPSGEKILGIADFRSLSWRGRGIRVRTGRVSMCGLE